MPSGILALFGKSSFKVADTKATTTTTATATDSVEFLRRNSAATLVEEPTLVETTKTPTDPYKLFIYTVENDLISMQKQKSMRQMRWKVPAGVDANQALRGCKRTGAEATTFDLEKIGSLSYVVARW
ncbi:hypothetical protein HDU87_005559 [Geranomyces variabilis]|uniref:Uncharacterized protein n=1 Tax=Geranomyces variabilis TaxID=109894 RepID=A0AAD5XL14_9FUNG|nr:hypothetical protein HDU87_005559 [Geranomyces variabilis]